MTGQTPMELLAELTVTRTALEELHHDVTGRWPLPTMTVRDITDAIRTAYQRAIDPPRRTEYDDSRPGEELL
mgnify:CR=1 FL=1